MRAFEGGRVDRLDCLDDAQYGLGKEQLEDVVWVSNWRMCTVVEVGVELMTVESFVEVGFQQTVEGRGGVEFGESRMYPDQEVDIAPLSITISQVESNSIYYTEKISKA